MIVFEMNLKEDWNGGISVEWIRIIGNRKEWWLCSFEDFGVSWADFVEYVGLWM